MTSAGKHRPPIAITVGDFNGIGPEVVLRSIGEPSVRSIIAPLLVGPASVFRYYARTLDIELDFHPVQLSELFEAPDWVTDASVCTVPVLQPSNTEPSIRPGTISSLAGKISVKAIEQAVLLAQMGIVGAIVTAPVSKQAMHSAGIPFPGQTEMLQKLTSAPRVGMMLVSRSMRVGLITIHVPIERVAATITPTLLRDHIKVFYHALVSDWAINKPRVAVLGLNPHAGEGGDIGTEEKRIVTPVVNELQRAGLDVNGPFPADAFFGRHKAGRYDAVIAMYHDQGLIPLKLSSFGKAVNVSVGLPIIRTSPGHGTAFDIAGKGIADPGSMIEAIKLARLILRNRSKVLAASVRALELTPKERKHSP
jgi:4-hydroxythreonine-4-phosphate dehydrogenase